MKYTKDNRPINALTPSSKVATFLYTLTLKISLSHTISILINIFIYYLIKNNTDAVFFHFHYQSGLFFFEVRKRTHGKKERAHCHLPPY